MSNRQVRVTTTGVYKWQDANAVQTEQFEERYEIKRQYNGLVLLAGLVLIGLIALAIANADMIRALLYG